METEKEKEMLRRHRHKRGWFGLIVILIGVLWLLKKLEVTLIPEWIFTWPMFLIAWGVVRGVRYWFRDIFSLVLILIGTAFLMRNSFGIPLYFEPYLWPSVIILIGLIILLRPGRWSRCRSKYHAFYHQNGPSFGPQAQDTQRQAQETNKYWRKQYSWRTGEAEDTPFEHTETDRSDLLEVVAVFGGVHRDIISKNFKGGDVVNVFAGTELNFSKADFEKKVVIDIAVVFGGLKIIVPPHWDVRVEAVNIAAGVDDKRRMQAKAEGEEKVLVISGTLLFGGIEIQSY